jgi:precorrin-4/cobalt-precorrin-4 C11-methyltransferase
MISFVGAGPGAPDLLTLRGAQRLRHADIVVWASSLVPEAVLEHCRPDVVLHASAIMPLEDVTSVFAASDDDVNIVRLHSGDPGIYGAIAEQLDWCRANGKTIEVVPGVTSVAAAAATLQRELTVPAISQSVIFTRLGGRTAA